MSGFTSTGFTPTGFTAPTLQSKNFTIGIALKKLNIWYAAGSGGGFTSTGFTITGFTADPGSTQVNLDTALKILDKQAKTGTIDTALKLIGISKTVTGDTVLKLSGIQKTVQVTIALKKLNIFYPLGSGNGGFTPGGFTVTGFTVSKGFTQFNIDSALKKLGLTTAKTIDTVLKLIGIQTTFPMDMVLKAANIANNSTIDSAFKSINKVVNFVISAAFQAINLTNTVLISSVFKARQSKTVTMDVVFVRQENNEVDFVLDTTTKVQNQLSLTRTAEFQLDIT